MFYIRGHPNRLYLDFDSLSCWSWPLLGSHLGNAWLHHILILVRGGGTLACFYLFKPSLTWHWAQVCGDAPSKHCQRECVLPEGRWDLALWRLWPKEKKTAACSFGLIPLSQLSASNLGLSQCGLPSWSSSSLCVKHCKLLCVSVVSRLFVHVFLLGSWTVLLVKAVLTGAISLCSLFLFVTLVHSN